MSFEDLLTAKPAACNVCAFLEVVSPTLAGEIRAAVGKAKYSHATLARGMAQLGDFGVRPPGKDSVKTHRERGHA